MPVYHSLTMTTPDNPAYENRPSHWNEAHSIDLSGSEVIGAFSNAGNVSFAVETNGRITASANVTAAASPVNVTAGTTSGNLQTIAFSNSNGVSFGLNGSTITAAHNGLTTAAQSNHSHGDPTLALTNLSGTTASNSAGLTLSLSAAAVPTAYVSSVNGSSGAISLNVGSSLSASTNGSSITFGLASNITTALQPAGAYLTTARASNDAIGTNTALTAGPLAWTANSAGLSLNAGSVAGTTSGFTGANISASITHNTAGLAMSMSVAAPGGAASQTIYAVGNTTVNSSGTFPLSAVSMRGYGIVSLGTSNGSVLISSPDPTTLAPSWYAVGNTTGASSSTTLAADTISIQGTGGVSVGYSNGSLVISGATGGAGGGYSVGLSTGGNTAGATGLTGSNMVFVGSGPISLSQTTGANGGTISINAPATSSLSATGILSISTNGSTISIGAGPVTVYAVSNTTQASSNSVHLSALSFQGAGVASVGVSNGSVVISVPAGGGAGDGYNILAAGTQTATTAGSVLFENSNGISFGMSGSTRITASHNGITSQSVQTQNMVSVLGSTGNISFDNGNGITFGANASTITASHNGLTSQSNQAASAANGSFAFQTVNFSNANGVSFVTSAGSAIAASVETSYAASNHSHGNPTLALTNLSGTTASNSAGLTLSLSAAAPGGGVTPAVSAANGSYTFSTLSFSNANGVSFGTSAGSAVTASYTVPSVTQYFSATNTTFNGANISGSMTLNTNGLQLSMSVAAPGAAAENNAIALLGANTAGNTTATGSTIGWSGIGVTLSGTNASQVVISAPATSSLVGTGILSISTNGSTISLGVPSGTATMWQPFNEAMNVAGQQGNAIMHIAPLPTPSPAALGELHVDRLCLPLIISNSSNSTGSVTISHSFGLYTKNVSTLSLVMSTSYTAAATFSGTVNNSTYAGLRLHTVPWTTTIGDGRYYVAHWSRTTTGGGNCTVNQWLASQANSNYSGIFGANSNRSLQYPLGYGAYSVSFSTAMPSSVAISAIDGTGSLVARPPSFFMINGTV